MATISRAELNERLKRINIKGKEYIDVANRIQGFWEMFPEGAITTTWLVMDENWCVCQATCFNNGQMLAQGTAKEFKSSSNINKTSYIENCESSAIGRCLGIAGIGSTESVASADEVQHAIDQQDDSQVKTATKKKEGDPLQQVRNMFRRLLDAGFDKNHISSVMLLASGKDNPADYTKDECEVVIKALSELLKQDGE